MRFTFRPPRAVPLALFLSFFLLFHTAPQTAQAQITTPPPVYVSLVVAGGDGNVKCCKNNGDPVEFQYRKDPYAVAPDPQVERYPTAARRNSSITVAFTYTCPFDSTIPFDGTIQADAGSGIGSAFYLESGGSEEIHLVAGQSKTVTYVLDGLPNYVGLTGLTFQFHYHWTYGDYTDGDIRMVIYLVHQNPQQPAGAALDRRPR